MSNSFKSMNRNVGTVLSAAVLILAMQPARASGDMYEASKYYDAGMGAEKAGDGGEAVAQYTQALQINPRFVEALVQRGVAHTSLKEFDQAIEDETRALELRPTSYEALYNRARAYWQSKRYDKAFADYRKALKTYPAGAHDVHLCLGLMNSDQFHWRRAVVNFTEALKAQPRDAVALKNRGTARAHIGEFEQAKEDLSNAVSFAPDDAQYRFIRSFIELALRQGKEASADAETYLNMKNGTGATLATKAYHWRDSAWTSKDGSAYMVIVGALGHEAAGEHDEARKLLSTGITHLDSKSWPYPLVQYLQGEISAASVFKRAVDGDQMTGAKSYMATKLSIAGNRKQDALDYAHWVVDHGNQSFIEQVLAMSCLPDRGVKTAAERHEPEEPAEPSD
jgi:tetratricopeptide (TPR) repeat protein